MHIPLQDDGVQCPGKRTFEYAIHFNKGKISELPNKAADIFASVKCAVCGRGKGELPLENSLFEIDNKNVHITAVKRADDGNGTVVRFYNPTNEEQIVNFNTKNQIKLCKMDETVIGDYTGKVGAKKIVTVRIEK